MFKIWRITGRFLRIFLSHWNPDTSLKQCKHKNAEKDQYTLIEQSPTLIIQSRTLIEGWFILAEQSFTLMEEFFTLIEQQPTPKTANPESTFLIA